MTDTNVQKQPENAADPKFDRWIFHDAWKAFLGNWPLMLLTIIGVAAFTVLSNKVQLAMFDPATDMTDVAHLVRMNVTISAITTVFYGLVFSVIAYAVHSTVLNGVYLRAAFGTEQRSLIFAYLKRFNVFVLIGFVVVVFEGTLVSLLFSSMLEQGYLVPIMMGLHFCMLIVLILLLTWPVSLFRDVDNSLSRAFARGKKTFWYFVGKNFLIGLGLLPFQVILSSILLPIMAKIFMKDAEAGNVGIPIGMLLVLGVGSGIFTAFFCCAEFVIVSRAFLIGEARLRNNVHEADKTAAQSEAVG